MSERDDVEQCELGYRLTGSFFEKQYRIALRNSDIIDPLKIEDYIALDGYKALADLLEKQVPPADVVTEMTESLLRGRGGAGFPTGRKWAEALKHDADHKYVICNADEGDPGAYMDRNILETDPHCVLEGMAIAGYAIGADFGYIYVRAEYPVAVKRLKIAIAQAEERGLLGDNIMGTDFSFHIELRLGAGAFVCGEGTAMMESIEGRRGLPRVKKYRTAHKGLFGYPTIINNVETLANVHMIMLKGAKWFRSIGTEKSPGTKVFALVGKVDHAGLVEVPMGTPLRDVVYDIGGGCKDGKALKAVQTGGPSGGCIPTSLIDTPLDFESLSKIGSIMGSGGMVIMDSDDCMVDIARF
ncbi:MAG TPA: NADH-quinone oxidoreductase subunit F, partial [Clostridiaceae bacterium]|nr:NADH-quinone oxidoreductase subunit F [Clostridiaceae bacterium]